jgi:hypothetical protein
MLWILDSEAYYSDPPPKTGKGVLLAWKGLVLFPAGKPLVSLSLLTVLVRAFGRNDNCDRD